MGHPFGPLPNFFACLTGGREGLLSRRRQPLARLAADDVAEGVLETLGAAIGRKPCHGAVLLLRAPLPVAPSRPGRVGLAETTGAVEGDREDEEADAAVHDPSLEEADGDQGEDDQRAEDAAEQRLGRAVFDRQRREAEEDQHHARGGDHGGVDRAAALLRPVDVVEVDPEGELIDRQPGSDSEEEGADLGPGGAAEGEEAGGTGDHHRHDPEDEVVEVDAAVADDAPGPPGDPRAALQPRAHADEGEGADEADEDEEEPLLVVSFQFPPEVGEDRGGGHAGVAAACRGGAGPSPAAISWTVRRAAATAKTGEKAAVGAAPAGQVPRKESPS